MIARRLGLATLEAGAQDSITDVPGVAVGHATIVEGHGPLTVGVGPVRTGVTIIAPHDGELLEEPLFAGFHRLNGNGEMTGLSWLAESGLLTSPIALTNTHSVGTVRDALIARLARRTGEKGGRWMLPVVAETWDGILNDVMGQHVTPEHVEAAFADLSTGPVATGNVGGGTGMICHGFKGGIGTSSRRVTLDSQQFTVGVLLQANHGRRERLRFGTTDLGRAIGAVPVPGLAADAGAGSVIGIVATDAPLLPRQLQRLAQRASLGIARTGGAGEHDSGDLFLAFSTANRGLPADYHGVTAGVYPVAVLHNSHINSLFDAVIEATEAAVLSALLGAQTMHGAEGRIAHALDEHAIEAVLDATAQLDRRIES